MIIDGKALASRKLRELGIRIRGSGIKPKLVGIMVGRDMASRIYLNLKNKRAAEVGIESEVRELSGGIGESEVIREIRELNADKTVHGILVQLPLPENFQTEKILGSIVLSKDVDGLTGRSAFLPATVRAVLACFEEAGFGGIGVSRLIGDPPKRRVRGIREFGGKRGTVVVVGQGRLVGAPLADYLEKQGLTVIRCDKFTPNLALSTRKGDVLITATGVPNLITAAMVKPGAIVIDCGSPLAEVSGDVFGVAGWISPVPGGVGPLTIACLLENTLNAAKIAFRKRKE